MGDLVDNLKKCMGCAQRLAPDANNRSVCEDTGRTIQEHATAGDCPRQFYTIGVASKCERCHGGHETARCPIPDAYDGNYHNDSGGTSPCNC